MANYSQFELFLIISSFVPIQYVANLIKQWSFLNKQFIQENKLNLTRI